MRNKITITFIFLIISQIIVGQNITGAVKEYSNFSQIKIVKFDTMGSFNSYRVTYSAPLKYKLDSVIESNIIQSTDSQTAYTVNNIGAGSTRRLFTNFNYLSNTLITTSIINGIISPTTNAILNKDFRVTFRSADINKYKLDSILVDNLPVSLDSISGYTFKNVNSSHKISVYYNIKKLRIQVMIHGNGSSSLTDTTINYGENVNIFFNPLTNNYFDSLVINGKIQNIGSVSQYQLLNITSDQNLDLYFSSKRIGEYFIKTIVDNGSISFPRLVSSNSNIRITYSPNNNFIYTLDSIFVNQKFIGNDSSSGYTFNNITGDSTITVKYRPNFIYLKYNFTNGGTVSPSGTNQTIVVPYNYNLQKFTFNPFQGYYVDSVFVDDIFVDSIRTYTFNNIKENHNLFIKFSKIKYIININQEGGGTVNPIGDTILYLGDNILLKFPSTTHFLDTLIVGATKTYFGPRFSPISYLISNISQSFNIRCLFRPNSNILISTKVKSGIITPNNYVLNNQSFRVTYKPIDTTYSLNAIFVDGVYIGKDSVNGYTFKNINVLRSIYVEYVKKVYKILSIADNNGLISPNGIQEYFFGTTARYVFQPNPNFEVDSVFVDNKYIKDSIFGYTFFNLQDSHTIRVSFISSSDSINISASTSFGGQINPSGSFKVLRGSNVTFNFQPISDKYEFYALFINYQYIPGNVTSYTFSNILNTKIIYVQYKIKDTNSISIRSSAGNGGTINPEGLNDFGKNTTVRFTFQPDQNYIVDSVWVDENYIRDSIVGYTFVNLTKNHTIRVKFKAAAIIYFTIYSSHNYGGLIIPNEAEIRVKIDTHFTFNFSPLANYIVDSVYVNGIYINNNNSYTFNNINQNNYLRVVFKTNSQSPLPTDIEILTKDLTCFNSNNGQIFIIAKRNFNYIATITSSLGFNNIDSFLNKDSIILNSLIAGSYKVCLSSSQFRNINRCYAVILKQPDTLTVNTQTIISENKIKLHLKGSNKYFVSINSKNFETQNNLINLELSKGINIIKIKGNLDCQGEFNKIIFVPDKTILFPNPTTNKINLLLDNNLSQLNVSIVNSSGNLVLNNNFEIFNHKLTIDVSNFPTDLYFIILKNGQEIIEYLKFNKQ